MSYLHEMIGKSCQTAQLPRVSIVVPCRNEEGFISGCLDSILRNDYPQDCLEILVVDGMSADRTWAIVGDYACKFDCVIPLRNEKRITPAGLNVGIAASSGSVICRMDAHARMAPDYLRRCVEALRTTGADNVGGAMATRPPRSTVSAKCIALCMSHWFGVGNSHFRVGARKPVYADTVFGGCYLRDVFARIGIFNERLERSQDIEFNQRLRRAGGQILLDPAIQCEYFSCADLRSFCKHNFLDGIWSILPFAFTNAMPVRLRHLIPFLAFAVSLVLGTCAIWFLASRVTLFFLAAMYCAASLVSALQLSFASRSTRCFAVMPLVFAIRHGAYGLGSFGGALKLAVILVQRELNRSRAPETVSEPPGTNRSS